MIQDRVGMHLALGSPDRGAEAPEELLRLSKYERDKSGGAIIQCVTRTTRAG
jgi:hypothetical protein